MKLIDLYKYIYHFLLKIYPQSEAQSMSHLLFQHHTGHAVIDAISKHYNILIEPKLEKIDADLEKLAQHVPIQYITKKAEFYHSLLQIDENVFIPRPETEGLVDWIVKSEAKVENLIDICCGSGCISVSLAKMKMAKKITAIDISLHAVAATEKNAQLNNVQITVYQADIFSSKIETMLSQPLSLIVSNPPYVRQSEKIFMQPNVLDYEPFEAIFVDDRQPLKFYKKIAQIGQNHLSENGKIYFEINEVFATEIVDILHNMNYKNIEIKSDFYGKDRYVRANFK
ncbi:MAG: peptide chain release factor N(5)-glutamine methyltransferase [Bacteroidales bacterium]|jgi:release factor glutamine methyltransferase|nr:peptide chain release factor N(5)-glutamine methyltransferase [Bacteroidales bacterium]